TSPAGRSGRPATRSAPPVASTEPGSRDGCAETVVTGSESAQPRRWLRGRLETEDSPRFRPLLHTSRIDSVWSRHTQPVDRGGGQVWNGFSGANRSPSRRSLE